MKTTILLLLISTLSIGQSYNWDSIALETQKKLDRNESINLIMKTKEEILEELFYKPETQDWYKPVLKAMETYAQQLRKPLVSGRSEQLKCDCGNTENVKLIPICPCCYNPHSGEW